MANFATVKQHHEKLLDTAFRDRRLLQSDSELRRQFEYELQAMIQKMEGLSGTLTNLDDYAWLSDAVLKWRQVSADVLNSPLRVKLRPPAGTITLPPVTRIAWSEGDFSNWLSLRAYEMYKDRVLTRHYSQSIRDVLERYGPSAPAEKDLDWNRACCTLGYAVLDGQFNFAEQFNPETYHLLQSGCWLTEIKRTAAYFHWLERAGGWDDGHSQEDWYRACQDIYAKLMADGIKASIVQFETVSRYLEERYLRAGSRVQKLDPEKAYDLIAAKARRLWEVTGRNAEANWADAVAYSKSFYEHIIPAVTASEEGHVRKVLEALQLHTADPVQEAMIDGFEICIAVFFVNAACVRRELKVVAIDAAPSSPGTALSGNGV